MPPNVYASVICALLVLAGCSDSRTKRVAGKLDPAQSTVEVDRGEGVVADGIDASQVTITLRDEYGDPLVDTRVELTVGGELVTVSDPVVTNERGIARATLTTLRSQTVTVRATVRDVTLPPTPTVAFVAGPAAALAFTVEPTSTEAGAVLAPSVEIALLDAYGNRVLTSTAAVSLALRRDDADATLLGKNTASVASGLAAFNELRIEKAASGYTLVASAQGVIDAESLPFDVAPAAFDVDRSSLVATPESAAANGVESVLLAFQAEDRFGNTLSGVEVSLTSSVENDAFEPAAGVTDDAGSFTATLASTQADTRTVTATVDGLTNEATVTFVPGAPDAEQSSASASPSSVPGNGVNRSTVSVVARDAFGNAVPNASVALSMEGANMIAQPGATDALGETQGFVASAEVGTKTIRVFADGVELVDAPRVTFEHVVPFGGTVSGLSGSGLVLVNNGEDALAIDENGAFAFPMVEPDGAYAVSIRTQPTNQACAVLNGAGVVAETGVNDIEVLCGSAWSEIFSATAGAHSFGRTTDGTLWAWGYNDRGQLGDGTNNNSITPVAIDTDLTFTTLSSGASHTLAIEDDGTLWAWGNNRKGQLGDGSIAESGTIGTVLSGTTFTSVAAGEQSSLGLKSDGTLWAWGLNDHGQLGDGSTIDRSTPVAVLGQKTFSAVFAGPKRSFALEDDGTLWTWGQGFLGNGGTNDATSPITILPDAKFTFVASGNGHSLALEDDGALWAWGNNTYGQLGIGSVATRLTPEKVLPETTFIAVAAGENHSLALESDGTLWAWGDNDYGQLGNGSTTGSVTPVAIAPAMKFTAIAAGNSHSLALKDDGTLWAWGRNSAGQLGTGDTSASSVPRFVP